MHTSKDKVNVIKTLSMHKLALIIGAHLLEAKNAESLFNSITKANKPLKKLKFQEMEIQENLH